MWVVAGRVIHDKSLVYSFADEQKKVNYFPDRKES